MQHFVHARAAKGGELEYFDGLVRVKGTLHINVTRDQGKVAGVYWMDVDTVEQDTVNIPWLPIFGVLIGLPIVFFIIRKVVTSRRPAVPGFYSIWHHLEASVILSGTPRRISGGEYVYPGRDPSRVRSG